ncbi:carbohydrate-binding module family 63 protein [Pleomassaria siparia CBS 279.74]|uniref:Carbohydrate-binding module family 63 protein n=1 Tax=Pleomassaria siparia CBS 279.74 TaxID=1314801 RepID=A0A6G1KSJ7_9PLEO|nr:carbohydrate-binding module family 63 protein [Pleomassaria siparia CBS 279.74]
MTTITLDTTTTETVRITNLPRPHYPVPNGTYPAAHPSTFASVSIIYVSPSPIHSEVASSETSQYVESTAPAAVSTSESLATTSSYEAPVAVSTSEAAAAASIAPVVAELATSSSVDITAAVTGEATFYGGNVDGGMCSFTGYTIPSGIYGTALSDSNWDGAESCGACVSVQGPSGNSVTAMIVDQCPGCGLNHLDLFPDAFAKLAQPSTGVIPVSWSFVPCGITTPLILKNKSGTSQYWFSMQVENANVRVSTLEVSTDGGSTWQATTRQPYNFFENSSGFGTDTVDVKVTSVDGKTVTVNSVSIASGTTKTAASNFA